MKLGNGEEAMFWDGMWYGDKPLRDEFPRLYQLSSKNGGKVKDMGRWENESWLWRVEWRRELRDCEKEWERKLMDELHGFSLTAGTPDSWV